MDSLNNCKFSNICGFFYNGRSMKSTFCNGDYLEIKPAKMETLQPGDVVVFQSIRVGETKEHIVHRVVDIQNGAVMTRGDDNLIRDRLPLDANRFLGKVMTFERNGRKRKVVHGHWGLMRSKRIRLVLLKKGNVLSLIRPMYSLLRKSRLIPKFWKPNLKKITLDSPTGQKIKYTHRGKTVFVRNGDTIIFKRRPYDLLF